MSLTTLADTSPGALVLINSGIGAGWTQGNVVSDGANVNLLGTNYPVSTRAVAGLNGYAPPAALPDATPYALEGQSSSGAVTWFTGGGVTFYGGSLSTLASVTGQVLVESVPNAGPWLARLV